MKYIVVNDFHPVDDLPTGYGFATIMKVYDSDQDKWNFEDMFSETYPKLIKNLAPVQPATYWLSAKDLKHLGLTAKSINVVPCSGDIKKNLEQAAFKLCKQEIKDVFE